MSSPGSTPDPLSAASPDGLGARERKRMSARVIFSSYLGSVIEWLDFYLYGVATALVFNVLFFPQVSAGVGIIASFGTFAVGYFARPLGGIIYGHFGDRIGRKKMLVSSIALMGVATVAVGLMPTYAQIGVWAPILLVFIRIIQGVAAGGEWGGALLMAMEHTSRKRRGLWTSLMMTGTGTGIALSTAAFSLVQLLPEDQFLSWGWRLPFLASALILVFAVWVRSGVEESPVFKAAQQRREKEKKKESAPLKELLRTQPGATALGILMVVGPFTFGTVFASFGVTYAIAVGFDRQAATNATLISSLFAIAATIFWGSLSDKIGRHRMYVIGLVALIVVSFVSFSLLNIGTFAMLVIGFCVAKAAHSMSYGPMGAYLGELFPVPVRYTGTSICYQVGGVVGGGLGPFIASVLLEAGGTTSWLIPSYLAAGCVLSLIAVLAVRNLRRGDPLDPPHGGGVRETAATRPTPAAEAS